ncbi:hypothetical protein MRX96_050588 [Rhipicephalus microplus]
MPSRKVSSTGHMKFIPLSSKQQSSSPSLKLQKQSTPLLLKPQVTTMTLKRQSTPQELKQQRIHPSLKQQPTPPSLKQQPTPPSLKQQSRPPSLKPLFSARLLPQPPLSRPLTGKLFTNLDSLFPDGYTDTAAKQCSSASTGQPQTLKSIVGNPPLMIDQRRFTRALIVENKHTNVDEQVYQRRLNLIWGGVIFVVITFALVTVGASLFSQTGERRSVSTESQSTSNGARNYTFKDIADIGNDANIKFEATAEPSSRLDVDNDAVTAYALSCEEVPAVYDRVPASTNSRSYTRNSRIKR